MRAARKRGTLCGMKPPRLMLCYDGSPDAKAAVERAAVAFAPLPAVVVCLWTTNEYLARSVAAEGAKLAETHGLGPVEPRAIWRADSVWETLLSTAGALGAGAIVLGLPGSEVVRHATLPVFLARRGGPVSRGVLVAYDGSDDARLAIAHAGRLFAGRSVTVLAVWQRPRERELAEAAAEAARICAREGAALAEDAGLDAAPLVRRADGPVWSAILEAADTLDAGTVVLGSRGLSGVRTWMLGSVSEAVLRQTERSALIVRHGTP
jgi:nucleotide-binding universal stress UspA family protein